MAVGVFVSLMVRLLLSSWWIALSEREDIGADAGIEEFDLERAVLDRSLLPDELIEARFLHAARTIGVHVGAMVGAGRHAVDFHAEANGVAFGRRQHKINVAGMKPVADGPGLAAERGELAADRPNPRQAPPVEWQHRQGTVEGGSIFANTAAGCEVSRLSVADIGLGRAQVLRVRRDLRTFGANGDEIAGNRCAAGLGQEFRDPSLGFVVAAL